MIRKTKRFAMLLSCVAGASACVDVPTRTTSEALGGCYVQVDSLGYNTLQVWLRDDGTYYSELNGDIGQWGSAIGSWHPDAGKVVFTPTLVEDAQPLPDHVDVLGHGRRFSLGLPGGQSPGPSSQFEPLKAEKCEEVGWLGAYLGKQGAPLPIADGDYVFQHRFAEHPSMGSVKMQVRVSGRHIVVKNTSPATPFPVGVVAEGTLLYNRKVSRWIIARDEADEEATEVGGCTDGPEVVDLEELVYWTC